MRDSNIVNTILQRVPQINFTTTANANEAISVFETNIRYIGGMLASKYLFSPQDVCIVLSK
jgi:mannosyl-oligosaccharide alpha-1,2-mannosidase